MPYAFLADLTVLVHLGFVAWVVAGGWLVLKWPRLAWLHLPSVAWGAAVELGGWVCPLTPLELRYRDLAGESGYAGGFVAHYLLPVLYPTGLTRTTQIALGLFVLAVNCWVYSLVIRRRLRPS